MPTVSMIHEKRNSSATYNKEHYNMHTYLRQQPATSVLPTCLMAQNILGTPRTQPMVYVWNNNSHGQQAPWFWVENIARIANAVQCHSLLSGHYDCHD